MSRKVLLVVSVDTEEDNWRPTRHGVRTENIRELPRLAAFLGRFGARVTYVTTYAVASRPWAAGLLRDVAADTRGEIGAHLHPWNTPPLTEPVTARNSMLKNLPAELQASKLATLTDTLGAAMGERPVTFRAGRYGIGGDMLRALIRTGYAVDTSVTPWLNWQDTGDGPSFIGAPSAPYRLNGSGSVNVPSQDGPLAEVPLTCGFNRWPFPLWHRIHAWVRGPGRGRLHLGGIAYRSRLVRLIRLSPEHNPARDMLVLSRELLDHGQTFLHLNWHSPTLVPGLTPFVCSAADVDRFYGRIAEYLSRLAGVASIRFLTVREAADLLVPARPTAASLA
jgi:hypothetical protein